MDFTAFSGSQWSETCRCSPETIENNSSVLKKTKKHCSYNSQDARLNQDSFFPTYFVQLKTFGHNLMLMIHEAMDSKLSYCLLVCILCTVCYFSGQPASFDRICNVQPEQTKYYAIYHNAMCSVPFLSFVLDSLFDHTAKSADIFTQFNSKILINLYDIYIYIYIYIHTHIYTFVFAPIFHELNSKI